jgi:hypothetical protein
MIRYNYKPVELEAIIVCSEVSILKGHMGSVFRVDEHSYDTAKHLAKQMDFRYSAIKDNSKIKLICDWDQCWKYLHSVIYYYEKKRK